MPQQLGTRIKGLRELDRAVGKADKRLRTDLRSKLRDIAGTVALEARGIAAAKGLRESGDLIRGIRPFALTGRAGVRSTATHRGFAYPLRLEFENKGGSRFGPLATVNPAAERREKDVEREAERLLGRIESDWRGGVAL